MFLRLFKQVFFKVSAGVWVRDGFGDGFRVRVRDWASVRVR